MKQLAPYFLFSLKGSVNKKPGYFGYHNGKLYTDIISNKVWNLQILIRSCRQHFNAFEFINNSEFLTTLDPKGRMVDMENIANSIKVYLCKLDKNGERLQKRYMKHLTSLEKWLENFREKDFIFEITEFNVESNLLGCVVNIQISTTTSDEYKLSDYLFPSIREDNVYEIGVECCDESTELFRIVNWNKFIYRDNIYSLFSQFNPMSEYVTINNSLEAIDSYCKRVINSNNGLNENSSSNSFSKPYLHILLLQAFSEFIISSCGLRVGLTHYKSLEESIQRINTLSPLIKECTILLKLMTDKDRDLGKLLSWIRSLFTSKTKIRNEIVFMRVRLKDFKRREGNVFERIEQLFECKRKLIPVFPLDFSESSAMGIYHFFLLFALKKYEKLYFLDDEPTSTYESVLELLLLSPKASEDEKTNVLYTKLEDSSGQLKQIARRIDNDIEELKCSFIEYPWRPISVEIPECLTQIDAVTCKRYVGFLCKFKHYFGIMNFKQTDCIVFDFLVTSFESIVILLFHWLSRKEKNQKNVYLVCLAENMVFYIEELFERCLTANDRLDIEIANYESTTSETHIDRMLQDILIGEFTDEDINLFLNSLCTECNRFNSRAHFSTLSNISLLLELVRIKY